MKSFDTNVAVRLLVTDDPSQCERAARAFREAAGGQGAFFTATVFVELSWVLRVACKLDRSSVASALRRLMSTDGVTVENGPIVRRALDAYESGLGALPHRDRAVSRVANRRPRALRLAGIRTRRPLPA